MSRRFLAVLLALETIFGTSCGGNDTARASVRAIHIRNARFYESQATSPSTAPSFAGLVRITNAGRASEGFDLAIRGYLFHNSHQLLAYIASIPPIYPNEPDYQKAWRFLTARAYVYTPFTADFHDYDPLLFINSVGYGYCDDFANALATIWQWQGYQSRVWWLSGHVVPEVNVNGRWMMFDAMLGVYYFDHNNDIASVDELSQDPDLVVHPINPIYDPSNRAYQEDIAGFYGTTQDNLSTPPQTLGSRGMQITLPPKSDFIFPLASGPNTFLTGGVLPSTPLYYLAQIQIPKIDADTYLQLPLFMVGGSGNGKIEINGQTYTLGSPQLSAFFSQFGNDNFPEPVTSILVHAGATKVVISMALSPFVVDGLKGANIRILPHSTVTHLDTSYLPSANATPTAVTDLLSGIGMQLFQLPYEYISPFSVSPQIQQLMNQSSSAPSIEASQVILPLRSSASK